ncbi:YdiU family protein [Rickettsiales bacterium]|nr:YdiU family protein [Rickettsiales bacterium]
MKIQNSYHQLGSNFYKDQAPDKIANPQLITFNSQLAQDLSFKEEFALDYLSGNKLSSDFKPISLAYAGHQFGHFVPQLGDGRAVLLGEIYDHNNNLFDICLKGSGKSFFSRNGDGKCPIDAAIREYLMSESMYFLNISTARSLALIKSDEIIYRENPIESAIITRIAKSHIRIGTFEYFACRNDINNLKILADYAINRHFLEISKNNNKYLDLLKMVMRLQADLVSDWLSVGFVHGVMNSDNVAISGQTIDYGPCSFVDEYDPNFCLSYIDQRRRYSFSNQKHIILWNLSKFAGSILPLINSDIKKSIIIAEEELEKFPNLFEKTYLKKMAQKIGIFNEKDDDINLIGQFLDILEENNLDFTNSFRILSKILIKEEEFQVQNTQYRNWQVKWFKRLKEQGGDNNEIAQKMDQINPILIPRNHIMQKIIKDAAINDDYTEFNKFLIAIKNPFIKQHSYNEYYQLPNDNERVKNTFCGT